MSTNLRRVQPSERTLRVQSIRNPQGLLDLRYGVWSEGDESPKQYVVFVNGRTEWIEKYTYLPTDLKLGKDVGFVSWDHRGQGASGGARAHVEDYGDFAADAAKVIEVATKGCPYVVVTHSMGGLVILTAIMNGLIKPKAVLMSSPLLGLPSKPLPTAIARPVARGVTSLGLGTVHIPAVGEFEKADFASNILTGSPERFARLKATPYPCPTPTFGWLDATFRATAYIFEAKNLGSYNTPTRVMVGEDEQVVDIGKIKSWVEVAKKCAPAQVEFVAFTGAKHELFSESEDHYRKAVAVVQSFLGEHLSR
jgi:lysophospholipase